MSRQIRGSNGGSRSPTLPASSASVLPLLPGAVAHLKVYDTTAPDGLRGGSPHVHLACTEAYYVMAGRGAVQTLSASGYREFPLEPVPARCRHRRDD